MRSKKSADDALTKFQAAYEKLLDATSDVDRHAAYRVKVRLSRSPIADAQSRRRQPKFLGYEILVHRGLYDLIQSATQFALSRMQVLSNAGDQIEGPRLTAAEIRTILHQKISDYVENAEWSSAEDHEEALKALSGSAAKITAIPHQEIADNLETVGLQNSCRLFKALVESEFAAAGEGTKLHLAYQYRITSGYMVLFTMAHELGHILLGHCDRPMTPFGKSRWTEEFEADAKAIKLVAESLAQTDQVYAQLDGSEFRWGNRIAPAASVPPVNALGAIAILFALLEMVQKCALQRGKHGWTKWHPPSALRFEALRTYCTSSEIYPEEYFSAVVTGLPDPDGLYLLFQYIGLGLSWRSTVDVQSEMSHDAQGNTAFAPEEVEQTWEMAGKAARSVRRRLDLARKQLEECLTVNDTDSSVRLQLSATLITLASACLNLDYPDEADVYLRMASRHLLVVFYMDGLDVYSFSERVLELKAIILDRLTQRRVFIASILANPKDDPQAALLCVSATWSVERNDFETAREKLLDALLIYDDCELPEGQIRVRQFLALVECQLGKIESALRYHSQLFEIAERHHVFVASAYAHRAAVFWDLSFSVDETRVTEFRQYAIDDQRRAFREEVDSQGAASEKAALSELKLAEYLAGNNKFYEAEFHAANACDTLNLTNSSELPKAKTSLEKIAERKWP